MKKELQMEKHYVVPLTNEGKFSSDRPLDSAVARGGAGGARAPPSFFPKK